MQGLEFGVFGFRGLGFKARGLGLGFRVVRLRARSLGSRV